MGKPADDKIAFNQMHPCIASIPVRILPRIDLSSMVSNNANHEGIWQRKILKNPLS